nr:MAG TPA: hypothetical protein [Caudoviricetes sp.]
MNLESRRILSRKTKKSNTKSPDYAEHSVFKAIFIVALDFLRSNPAIERD